ncbi:hypothetical protein K8I28_08130 [bacterium]|nr:hypothetical protein [bacterium]
MKYRTLIILFLIIAQPLCTFAREVVWYTPPAQVPDDRRSVPKPKFCAAPNDFASGFENQFIKQGDQMVDLARQYRHLVDNPKEAYNVNAFGEVENSSWFTNRNTESPMTPEEIRKGVTTGNGPATDGLWTVIRAKAEGVTPGFAIRDNRGDQYFIKFDPIGFSEQNSGADVVSSRLFYAAGYFTPENYIVSFDPDILTLGGDVSFTDDQGWKREMTLADLKAMLERVEVQDDGTVRAMASKYIEGEVLGPFSYRGIREDDFNDFIPHEHRRELRGLYVFSAWLNHIDAKDANSMDSYVVRGDRKYVQHFMMDFGTTLGSGGRGPQPIYRGHENEFDPHAFLFRILTFGLYSPAWERDNEVKFPSIGRYESKHFQPEKFKTIFPNPTFENMTPRDAYWGVKMVMSFADDQLDAAVEAGEYSDPDAAEYLATVLKKRRDITGKYWFKKLPPLDNFILEHQEENIELQFDDLYTKAGFAKQTDAEYRYEIFFNLKPTGEPKIVKEFHSIPIELSSVNWDNQDENQLCIRIQAKHRSSEKWSAPLDIYVDASDKTEEWQLLGVERWWK